MTTSVQSAPAHRIIEVPLIQGNRTGIAIEIPDELAILDDAETPRVNSGLFRILTARDGDKRVTWSRASIAEIRAAKKLFADLIKQGMVPYRVGPTGKATKAVMRKFEPRAEEVIFLPMAAIAAG